MKTIITYTFILSLVFGFVMSLKPAKPKIKVVREIEIYIAPNYNNNGLNKAYSG
jgi:hypothetical protein